MIAFNTAERWSQDVSEDIAAENSDPLRHRWHRRSLSKTSLQAARVRIASSPCGWRSMSWDHRFAEAIALPDGVKLASLREAIAHLVKTIPSSDRGMPAVLTAAEAAEHDGPVGLRVLLLCGQSIATLSGCLTPRAKTALGTPQASARPM